MLYRIFGDSVASGENTDYSLKDYRKTEHRYSRSSADSIFNVQLKTAEIE